jgi:ABC-2 type transport system ATP-binding protein
MSPDTAIKVDRVSKTFRLPKEKQASIKSSLINFKKRGYEKQQVLDEISFEIKKGEFFGIVGRNGSGKSTLLKLLAGIYVPDKGSIDINGKLTPFIELGVGFNPELTGRENVFLNGALLGFNRREMDSMYDDIVSFAELERFMDQKLKNYSSGMQVRLAFSIAIQAQSDILVLDEVLAVGDIDFQQKCYNYFNELKRREKTVVLVTHDMGAVRRFCDRGMLINQGELVAIGGPNEIAKAYEKVNLQNAERRLQEENTPPQYAEREGNRAAEIVKTETFNTDTKKLQTTFMAGEKIGVRIHFKAHSDISRPSLGFIFQDEQDVTVFATNNHILDKKTPDLAKGQTITLESVVDNVFTNGEYTMTCAIESDDLEIIYDRIEHVYTFLIAGHQLPHATSHPPHSFKIELGKGAAKNKRLSKKTGK